MILKVTLKEHAYNCIKQKILNCEYQPGMFLSEDLLKNEMNMSRTPIRDAISRLEQENLVRILPKKGILVSGISIREIQSIYEARLLLEPYAVLHYGNRIPEQRYLEFLRLFAGSEQHTSEKNDGAKPVKRTNNSADKGADKDADNSTDIGADKGSDKKNRADITEHRRLYEADSLFHTMFVEASENIYLISMYDQIASQNRRLRILSGGGINDRLIRTMEEHGKIIENCLAQDWESASEQMREHLLHSRKASFDVVLKDYDLNL